MKPEEAIELLENLKVCKQAHTLFNIEKEAVDMAITALKEETICPILSDDEVKQPCIKSPCGIERVNGDCRDRLKKVFREQSRIIGSTFHLSEVEKIIDGEDWL